MFKTVVFFSTVIPTKLKWIFIFFSTNKLSLRNGSNGGVSGIFNLSRYGGIKFTVLPAMSNNDIWMKIVFFEFNR